MWCVVCLVRDPAGGVSKETGLKTGFLRGILWGVGVT